MKKVQKVQKVQRVQKVQSKKSTLTEVCLNTGSGFIVSLILTSIMLPYMNIIGSFGITCIFTVISLVRSYLWRRFFNKKISVKYKQMEQQFS